MSDRPESPPEDCSNRPYELSRPMSSSYASAAGHEGLQFPPGMLQDPGLLFNKAPFNGLGAAHTQSFSFPAWVGGDVRHSEAQVGDFPQLKHWYPFPAPEYTGQVAGATAATQPANLSPPIAETREQIKMPEVKTEKDGGEEYDGAETKLQPQFVGPAASVPAGVYYPTSAPWAPSFWPGIPHMAGPPTVSQAPPTPSASSPSLSPSPPGNGFGSTGFYTGGAAHTTTTTNTATGATNATNAAAQVQSSARSSGSSSGGCSDSEEEVFYRLFSTTLCTTFGLLACAFFSVWLFFRSRRTKIKQIPTGF